MVGWYIILLVFGCCIDDGQEVCGYQGGVVYQFIIDIGLCEQFFSVVGFYVVVVKDW